MSLMFASRKLGETLFVQLQQPDGTFLRKGVLQTGNLFVAAGYSHMMTSITTLSFFENVFLPIMPDQCILLLASWARFSNHEAITARVPVEKKLNIRTIPPGTTRRVQPVDIEFSNTSNLSISDCVRRSLSTSSARCLKKR